MAYKLIWEEKGVTANFKGTVNDLELSEIVSKFYSHEKFDFIRYLLISFIGVEKFNITSEALEEVGAMDYAAALSNPDIKVAVVSDNDAILDMFSSYVKAAQGSTWSIRYFGSTNEARKWMIT